MNNLQSPREILPSWINCNLDFSKSNFNFLVSWSLFSPTQACLPAEVSLTQASTPCAYVPVTRLSAPSVAQKSNRLSAQSRHTHGHRLGMQSLLLCTTPCSNKDKIIFSNHLYDFSLQQQRHNTQLCPLTVFFFTANQPTKF